MRSSELHRALFNVGNVFRMVCNALRVYLLVRHFECTQLRVVRRDACCGFFF